MLDKINKLQEVVDRVIEGYKNDPTNIISAYKGEAHICADYRGRQIYELLQNADDCYTDKNKDVDVCIELNDNELVVQNTGKAFDENGLDSLMHTNASSKNGGTIGCKGLGFRSLLNWSNELSVMTKDFRIDFSEKLAEERFKEFSPDVLKEIAKKGENGLNRVAILSSAKILDNGDEKIDKYPESGYATAILLNCKEDVVDNIAQELGNLQFEELLFVEHIRNIVVNINGITRKMSKNEKENGRYSLMENGVEVSDWQVWTKSGDITLSNGDSKKYELAVAYKQDSQNSEDCKKNKLYSYFKTDISMPFSFLVHGTFALDSARNTLVKGSEENAKMVDCLIDFLLEISANIATENAKNGIYNYDALKFLAPGGDISELFSEYQFSEKLKDKIKECKIFPSINNEYLSLADNPKFQNSMGSDATYAFSKYVDSEVFYDLLKDCEDKNVQNFMQYLDVKFYDYDKMAGRLDEDTEIIYNRVECIDADSKEYADTISQLVNRNANLLKCYYEAYKTVDKDKVPKLLVDKVPKLLLDKKYTLIPVGTLVYLNPQEEGFEVPDWAKKTFINSNMEKKLKELFALDSSRDLTNMLAKYSLKEYSTEPIAHDLSKQAREEKDKNKNIDFVKWLYKRWEKDKNTILSFMNKETDSKNKGYGPLKVELLCADGSFEDRKKCYFGECYDNEDGVRLTKYIPNVKYISEEYLDCWGAQDKDNLISFFEGIGVSKYPKVENKELDGEDLEEYINYNKVKYPKLKYGDKEWDYAQFFAKKKAAKVWAVDGLKDILVNADFDDIICWVLGDDTVKKYAVATNESPGSSLKGKKNEEYVCADHMTSWIHEIFARTKWLPVKAQSDKVAAADCMFEGRDLPDLDSLVNVLAINYEKILTKHGENRKKDVEAFLYNIGVRENLTDLPKEKIYDILLCLPALPNGCKKAKAFYRVLNKKIDSKMVDKLVECNASREKFAKEGKVLARQGSEESFHPVNEVYYMDKKLYSEDMVNKINIPMLVMPRKQGEDKITKMFCVNKASELGEVKIQPVCHSLNGEYEKVFREVLPYIAVKCAEDNRKQLSTIKLVLISGGELSFVKQDGEVIEAELGDYEMVYIKSEGKAYIKIPTSIDDINNLKCEKKFRWAVADVLATALNIEDQDTFANILECSNEAEFKDYFARNGGQDWEELEQIIHGFNKSIDYKDEFWSAVSGAAEKDKTEIQAKYEQKFSGFAYKSFNDDKILDIVIDIFRELDIDMNEYNEKAFVKIYLFDYYKGKLNTLINSYRNRYYCYYAKKLQEAGESKKSFANQQNKYEHACDYIKDSYNITNSVNLNVQELYEQMWDVKIAKLNEYGEDYRAEVDCLKDEEEKVQEESHQNQDVRYDGDSKDMEIESSPIESIVVEVMKPEKDTREVGAQNGKKNTRHGKYQGGVETQKTRDLVGRVAERAVYNSLKTIYGDDLHWISGNSEKAGIIGEQVDDTAGYDMWYWQDGQKHYIEVKGTSHCKHTDESSTITISFNLSANERRFAEANKDMYEICFVFVDKERERAVGEVQRLGNIFDYEHGGNFFDNNKFDVECDGYKISASIKLPDEKVD